MIFFILATIFVVVVSPVVGGEGTKQSNDIATQNNRNFIVSVSLSCLSLLFIEKNFLKKHRRHDLIITVLFSRTIFIS